MAADNPITDVFVGDIWEIRDAHLQWLVLVLQIPNEENRASCWVLGAWDEGESFSDRSRPTAEIAFIFRPGRQSVLISRVPA